MSIGSAGENGSLIDEKMLEKYLVKGYLPTIGIECHVQLNTATKLFSATDNNTNKPNVEPNSKVSVIDYALPGMLPVLNHEAVVKAARAGKALNSEIAHESRFDRKHYFYPDLPKGYQITQMYQPTIVGGWVDLPSRQNGAVIASKAKQSTNDDDKPTIIVDIDGVLTSDKDENYRKANIEISLEPDFNKNATPRPDAHKVLKKLHEKYKLIILTSRVKKVLPETTAWLDKHFPQIFDEIYISGFYDIAGKTLEAEALSKAERLTELGVAYTIDDEPRHAVGFAEFGGQAIMFGDYNWNRDIAEHENVTRAKNWKEIAEYFSKIADSPIKSANDEKAKIAPETAVRIHHAHLEEDAGKLTHFSDYSLVDLNRAGTPLIEIVGEPDIHSAAEAREYAEELHGLMTFAGVTFGDLYYGNMRFDVNISIAKPGEKLGIRAEIKNLNSFRSVERATNYEINRQIEQLEKGEKIVQETRGWLDDKQKTVSQRSKEDAQDYRYMPDADIPPVVLTADEIAEMQIDMPILPPEYRTKFAALKVDDAVVRTILRDQNIAKLLVEILDKAGADVAKRIANLFVSTLPAEDEEKGSADDLKPASVIPSEAEGSNEIKVIIIHGNGGGSKDDNWQPWLTRELEKHGVKVVNETFPDAERARAEFWLPYLEKLGADENTILVGGSSGAVAAMRYAENHQLLGSFLIGVYYTDLGMEDEKQSGYFDKPWQWDNIKNNQKFVVQFAGLKDPWVPIDEARFVHENLDTEYYEEADHGHFAEDEGLTEFPELLEKILEKNDWILKQVQNDAATCAQDECLPSAENLIKLAEMFTSKEISSTAEKEIFGAMMKQNDDPRKIAEQKNLLQVSDESAISAIVDKTLNSPACAKAVQDFKNGEEKVIGFLVGQVMKASKGQANPGLAQKLIREKLQ